MKNPPLPSLTATREVEGHNADAGLVAHSTVGLQHRFHGGLYNAYAGRVPVFIILGNTIDEKRDSRASGVE